jgi:hypothetical protein
VLRYPGIVRTVTALSDAVNEAYFGAVEENEVPVATPELLQLVYEQLAAIATPLVSVCCDPESTDALYLLEDGLELWCVALQRLPSALLFPMHDFALPDSLVVRPVPAESCDWLAMLPRLVHIVGTSFELLEVCLRVFDQYFHHIGAEMFLVSFATANGSVDLVNGVVIPLYQSILGKVVDTGVILALKPLEKLVRLSPNDYSSEAGMPPSLSAMASLFEQLAGILFVSCAVRDATDALYAQLPARRKRADPAEEDLRRRVMALEVAVPNSLVAVGILNVFARLALHHEPFFTAFWADAATFSRICEHCQQVLAGLPASDMDMLSAHVSMNSLIPGSDARELYDSFVEIWMSHIEQMGPFEWRKLSAAALAHRAVQGDEMILRRSHSVYAVIKQVIALFDSEPTSSHLDIAELQPSVSREERLARSDPLNLHDLNFFSAIAMQLGGTHGTGSTEQ